MISVVLTAYNDERWLRAAIESVLAQTHTDFELLLIDDGSQDATLAIMQEYADRDARVRVFTHENRGVARSRNAATGHCRGDWIAVMDADDEMMPSRLERQVAFVEQHPRLAVTSCLAYLINEEGDVIGQTTSDLLTEADFERYVADGTWFRITHSGTLMRKDVVERVGGYREQLRYMPDSDLWFRISEAGGLILVQPERLMRLRKRRGSVSARSLRRVREPVEHGRWITASMEARRAGRPEPTLEQFRQQDRQLPLLQRLNRWRWVTAETSYRVAVLYYSAGAKVRAVPRAAWALILSPRFYASLMVGKLGGGTWRKLLRRAS
jgi:glycosyltransferase involved in cell wall biosynthesis